MPREREPSPRDGVRESVRSSSRTKKVQALAVVVVFFPRGIVRASRAAPPGCPACQWRLRQNRLRAYRGWVERRAWRSRSRQWCSGSRGWLGGERSLRRRAPHRGYRSRVGRYGRNPRWWESAGDRRRCREASHRWCGGRSRWWWDRRHRARRWCGRNSGQWRHRGRAGGGLRGSAGQRWERRRIFGRIGRSARYRRKRRGVTGRLGRHARRGRKRWRALGRLRRPAWHWRNGRRSGRSRMHVDRLHVPARATLQRRLHGCWVWDHRLRGWIDLRRQLYRRELRRDPLRGQCHLQRRLHGHDLQRDDDLRHWLALCLRLQWWSVQRRHLRRRRTLRLRLCDWTLQ